MSALRKLSRQVIVKQYLERERHDGSGSFPVVVFEGFVTKVTANGGTHSEYKDNVSYSLFGSSLEVAKKTFGEVGTIHKDIWIRQYRREEPREWTNPETGQVVTITHDFTIVDEEADREIRALEEAMSQKQSAPAQSQPIEHVPMEVGTDA